MREGEVASGVSEDLLVAAMAGFLSQFARALYFGELSGDAKEWVPAIEQTLRALLEANREEEEFARAALRRTGAADA